MTNKTLIRIKSETRKNNILTSGLRVRRDHTALPCKKRGIDSSVKSYKFRRSPELERASSANAVTKPQTQYFRRGSSFLQSAKKLKRNCIIGREKISASLFAYHTGSSSRRIAYVEYSSGSDDKSIFESARSLLDLNRDD